MSSVPDEVFAQEIVGPGLAIEPLIDIDVVAVVAPVTGTITSVFPHAFAIDAGEGKNVLVHLGIDTVSLAGQGFEVKVAVGSVVQRGDLAIIWTIGPARSEGLSTVCPVVLVQAEAEKVHHLAAPETFIQVGEDLLEWR